MKRFKHTRRSGFAFVLFGPFTLFIMPWVVLAHARSEINSMHEGRPGYKKSMPCICAFLLGLFTLFIVPLVWTARLANKIKRLSEEVGVEKKPVSGGFMVGWLLFGSLILIGPFVAWMKFFRSLNRLEDKLNEQQAAAAESATVVEENVKEEENVEEQPAEEQPAEQPVEEQPVQEEQPAEEQPAEKPVEEQPVQEEEHEPEVIQILPPEKRKYRVRMANNKKVIRYFETKEDAIAYAKGVAKSRKVNVIVK